MGLLPIHLDTVSASFVQGVNDATPFNLPKIHQEDSLPIEFRLLKRLAPISSDPPFEVINLTGYALKISVGIAGNVYASQSTWTLDATATVLSGAVDLASVASGVADGTKLLFEARVTDPDGNNYRGIQETVWCKSVATSGAVVSPPVEVGITVTQAVAMFLPKGALAGITLVDTVTAQKYILYIADGAVKIDPVT